MHLLKFIQKHDGVDMVNDITCCKMAERESEYGKIMKNKMGKIDIYEQNSKTLHIHASSYFNGTNNVRI